MALLVPFVLGSLLGVIAMLQQAEYRVALIPGSIFMASGSIMWWLVFQAVRITPQELEWGTWPFRRRVDRNNLVAVVRHGGDFRWAVSYAPGRRAYPEGAGERSAGESSRRPASSPMPRPSGAIANLSEVMASSSETKVRSAWLRIEPRKKKAQAVAAMASWEKAPNEPVRQLRLRAMHVAPFVPLVAVIAVLLLQRQMWLLVQAALLVGFLWVLPMRWMSAQAELGAAFRWRRWGGWGEASYSEIQSVEWSAGQGIKISLQDGRHIELTAQGHPPGHAALFATELVRLSPNVE